MFEVIWLSIGIISTVIMAYNFWRDGLVTWMDLTMFILIIVAGPFFGPITFIFAIAAFGDKHMPWRLGGRE